MTAGCRSPVHLALAAWAAATVGELVPLRAAGADGPTAEMRARLEEAFTDGRITGLESLAVPGEEPVSVEPLAVRDLFWRPVTGPRSWKDPRGDLDPTGVSARRIAWLRAHAAARLRGEPGVAEPYPTPGAGEDEPYPRLTAWVLDRLLRETEGSDSLGKDGPLGALRDDELAEYWVRAFRRPAYAGPGADGDLDAEARAKTAAVRAGVTRAKVWAFVSVGVWVTVGGLLLLLRGKRVKPPPPSTDA